MCKGEYRFTIASIGEEFVLFHREDINLTYPIDEKI